MNAPSPEIWAELGIEPTRSIPAIKHAYATRLKRVSPEIDPKGFSCLRHAYELALAWAEATEQVAAVKMESVQTEPPSTPLAELVARDPELRGLADAFGAAVASRDYRHAATLLAPDSQLDAPPLVLSVAMAEHLARAMLADRTIAPDTQQWVMSRCGWLADASTAIAQGSILGMLGARLEAGQWFANLHQAAEARFAALVSDDGAVASLLLGRGRPGLLSRMAVPVPELRRRFSELLLYRDWLQDKFDPERLDAAAALTQRESPRRFAKTLLVCTAAPLFIFVALRIVTLQYGLGAGVLAFLAGFVRRFAYQRRLGSRPVLIGMAAILVAEGACIGFYWQPTEALADRWWAASKVPGAFGTFAGPVIALLIAGAIALSSFNFWNVHPRVVAIVAIFFFVAGGVFVTTQHLLPVGTTAAQQAELFRHYRESLPASARFPGAEPSPTGEVRPAEGSKAWVAEMQAGAAQGQPLASLNLGKHLVAEARRASDRDSADKLVAEAIPSLKRAAGVYSEADVVLAGLYESGFGVPQDLVRARSLYQSGGGPVDPHAAAHLAFMELHGIGGPAEIKQALSFIRQAARFGPEPMTELGLEYMTGTVLPKRVDLAVEMLSVSATAGDFGAMLPLAEYLGRQGSSAEEANAGYRWARLAQRHAEPDNPEKPRLAQAIQRLTNRVPMDQRLMIEAALPAWQAEPYHMPDLLRGPLPIREGS